MARSTKSKKSKRGEKTKSGGLPAARRNALKASTFAFPEERKEPLNDAKHVRNAIARFDQVEGVNDQKRDAAWRRIRKAAKRFAVDVSDRSWRSLGRGKRIKATKGKAKKGKAKKGKAKKGKAKKGNGYRS